LVFIKGKITDENTAVPFEESGQERAIFGRTIGLNAAVL
jgi:hypothetical protein